MKVMANEIIAKPSDYKSCKKCKSLNWYENEICHACDHTKFTNNEDIIIGEANEYIAIDYDYNEEFYETHEDIDPGDEAIITVR